MPFQENCFIRIFLKKCVWVRKFFERYLNIHRVRYKNQENLLFCTKIFLCTKILVQKNFAPAAWFTDCGSAIKKKVIFCCHIEMTVIVISQRMAWGVDTASIYRKPLFSWNIISNFISERKFSIETNHIKKNVSHHFEKTGARHSSPTVKQRKFDAVSIPSATE